MSMIVTSISASKNTCPTTQWAVPFSFRSLLNVFIVAGAYLQTGFAQALADRVTIYPATIPNYCQENVSEMYGEPIFGNEVNRLCLIDCASLYRQKIADAHREEQLLVAQFKLGKCLACPWLYPPIMTNEVSPEQTKKEKEEHLEGLSLMYRSGCLN